ncbi:MAG: glycosyltransferase family 4 protein [Actinomycetia bacterium]|nr:glycosyltransferase family 4 protein [Actinomycetes bacterium]
MKLLLVSHSSNIGGTETCFGSVLQALAARPEVDLIAAYPDGVHATEWESLAQRIPYAGSLPPRFYIKGYAGCALRAWTQTGALRRSVREWRPDAVVVFTSVAVAPVAIAHQAGVPCVCYVRERISPLGVRLRLWRWLSARVARIIAVSDAIAAEIEMAGCHNVTVVNDGIALPERVEAAPSRMQIGFFGGYDPNKGGDVFVAAARQILDSGADVDFVYHGVATRAQEAFSARIRRAVDESGFGDRMRFVQSRDFTSAFDAVSLVVVPSRSEALPLVALEALAHGRPVVASAVGGLVDLLGDAKCGRLVPSEDAVALASAVVELTRDEAGFVAMAASGRKLVSERYSIAKSVDGLISVIESVLSGDAR